MVALAAIYLMLRGRIGLVLTAIRDDEVAARSSGVRIGLARLLVFVVAGIGCGAAGALLAISQLQVQPGAVFSVQWTAEMAFATIIGGLGTIEGPILGTAVYMVLQQTLASYNAWYLIVLGLVAIAIALWSRRGLWGLVDEHLHVRLFPVGYWLWPGDQEPPASRLLSRLRRTKSSPALQLRRPPDACYGGRSHRPDAGPQARRVAGVRHPQRGAGACGVRGHPRVTLPRVILERAAERDGGCLRGRGGDVVPAGQGRGPGQGPARGGPAEVAIAVAYLSGELPQRQIGVGWATLRQAAPPAAEPSLTLTDVDAAFTAIGALAGKGSMAARKELVTRCWAGPPRASRTSCSGCCPGELHQGALEGVMAEAVARAAQVPRPRCAGRVMFRGSMGAVAQAALAEGSAGLARVRAPGGAADRADAGLQRPDHRRRAGQDQPGGGGVEDGRHPGPGPPGRRERPAVHPHAGRHHRPAARGRQRAGGAARPRRRCWTAR